VRDVDDRKAVLGLFNAAYEMSQNQSDPSFPRLRQMVINYDPPLKKLSEEFVPHTRTLTHALLSLSAVYPRRNLSADQWHAAQMLSLVSNPSQLLTHIICSDQPGLLGPKTLFVFMGLCFSRDEINNEKPPPRQGKVKTQEDLVDRYLPSFSSTWRS
jgi:hypothetical protein